MKKYFEKIYRKEFKDFIEDLKISLKAEKKEFIITANPETFMIGQENSKFDRILKADYTTIVPDGIGIVKAANILGIPLRTRITGVEICQELLRILNDQRKTIFLLGAREEIGEALCKKITSDYPNIKIVKYVNGYVEDKDSIMQEAVLLKPDVVLVALGIPNQEILIDKYFAEFEKGIFIGVGGSFDVLSGMKKRAPQIFIKCNLEWLYRIVSEPKRIKRFYFSNVKFLKKIRRLKRDI